MEEASYRSDLALSDFYLLGSLNLLEPEFYI